MNKTSCLLLLLIFGFRPWCGGAPDDDPAKASAFFTELRMNYAHAAGFEGAWIVDPEREALVKTYDEKHPDEFIASSAPWLKKCPVDARVHLMRASLLLKIGDVSGHFYHRLFYYGLMTSIASSGDGKTPQTAYKVISVDEEYPFLNHIGAEVKSQALVKGPCDAMTVQWGGKETTIYFDVSIPMSVLQKTFGGEGEKK